jgi:ATP-dependent Zn protease
MHEDELVSPIRKGAHDIALDRERMRRRRVYRLAAFVLAAEAYVIVSALLGRDPLPSLPAVDPLILVPVLFFGAMLLLLVGTQVGSARSPHLTYRPEQVDVRLDDVIGIDPVKEDVRRSIDLFQTHRQFADQMGGTPRRGLLFEGAPGTGKTMTAKAMAAEAGVPFLFVSATSFQSMYYGATARKIRAYFRALRRAARTEGGAIGFIEEIDAIALRRGGMLGAASSRTLVGAASAGAPGLVTNAMMSEGTGGVVNELLVQMQSFDALTPWQRFLASAAETVNLVLPRRLRLPLPKPDPSNVLIIAATNRADALDPALLRPGRFDRRLVFDLPDKAGRRELVDHFLARKAHEPQLDEDDYRDALAGVTQGYSPARIEHLLDEALVNTDRRAGEGMTWKDIENARIVTEVGLGRPVGYTDHERRLIATHEAGHAVVAWLLAPQRRLEILTIVKRGVSLGMLQHGDREDVYTRSKRELEVLVGIAFGGQVAEEIFFGDVSTGPSGDLAFATTVAAQMVGQAGMDSTLVSLSAAPATAFGGGDLVSRVLGDSGTRELVEALLARQKQEVSSLLRENRHLVAALRDALLEKHELIGHEIEDVLTAARRAA